MFEPSVLPLISVVVTTFRRPTFLVKALDSVESARSAQGLDAGAMELVVVDDGHERQVLDLCERFRKRSAVCLVYLESSDGPGAGPSHCRNLGVRHSRGSVIYLLDDDDAFLPNRFVRSLPLLRDGLADGVLERTLFVGRDIGSKGYEGSATRVGPNEHLREAFTLVLAAGPREQHVTTGATAFLKSAFEAAGGYDETLRYGEDSEFLLRLCLVGRVVVDARDPVLRYTVHGEAATNLDRLQVWHNVKWLSRLSRKVRGSSRRREAEQIHAAASGKLDYALYYYRRHCQNYLSRLRQGVQALRYYDWRCLNARNVKSIVVWLLWPAASS